MIVHSSAWMQGLDTDKDLERKIEALEMWHNRRIMKVSWTEKMSNE